MESVLVLAVSFAFVLNATVVATIGVTLRLWLMRFNFAMLHPEAFRMDDATEKHMRDLLVRANKAVVTVGVSYCIGFIVASLVILGGLAMMVVDRENRKVLEIMAGLSVFLVLPTLWSFIRHASHPLMQSGHKIDLQK